MQTDLKSTGTQLSSEQNNLKNEELNELKKQNKIIVKFLAEMEENQKVREQEQKAMISKLKETTEVFRSSGIKANNDFVDIATNKLGKSITCTLSKKDKSNYSLVLVQCY